MACDLPRTSKINPATAAVTKIQKNTVLPYLITFENDPSALAPAQIVIITDYLDTTKVEPVSLEFGTIQFGRMTVTPPSFSFLRKPTS